MFGSKIKVEPRILDKVRVAANIAGASSVEEFAASILEAEADRVIASTKKKEASAEEIEQIANQLKGLGYLE